MGHNKLLDSATVIKDAVTKEMVGAACRRTWKLKKLCQEFLDKNIQESRSGHDCFEDTFVTKEVLIWLAAQEKRPGIEAVASFCSYEQQKQDSIPSGAVADYI
ncbi:hypothetical protein BBP40_003445 [Aspergillus hancockii]|nr:hypothetical protein BBP40_003445 [Aspergillus hancockii]